RIFLPERNRLIVDTWCRFAQGRRTVIFCASVKHAEEIAELLRERGVAAAAVSGTMKQSQRLEFKDRFAAKEITVLCACDLLNEGWDCPETEVLFMARPTMSKMLYTQQLGRGMRRVPGKESVMVFDFVDNAGIFNQPYSIHRLLRLNQYKPGALVAAPNDQRRAEEDLYTRGEKPEALIDWPVDALDYEVVDLFNWQEEAEGMISQMEFIRRVDVQSETVKRYIDEGKLVADLTVPMSARRKFHYFKEETLLAAAERFGWRLINDSNRKDMFMEMIREMDMTFSYKPVLIKAVLQAADAKGMVKLDEIVAYFRQFYDRRRKAGLVVEKSTSIYNDPNCTDAQIRRNILANPFKRFEDRHMLSHTKTLGIIKVDEAVWKRLSADDKEEIIVCCDRALEAYYAKLQKS
ncbi:MAG: hypothetical protein IKE64_10060, partial [Thermoguttaceae bacterium]|nr:hypothetical protein [Thermoguttaceae bacterium]